MGVISIIFDSIVTNIFSALWIVGWIFYINHTTGIYSNLSELSRDVYVCNKTINTHINTKETETEEQDDDEHQDEIMEERLKKLEEDLEHALHKLSKVKKLYVALSENVANLNDRVIDIEDELDENYEDSQEEEEEEEDDEEEQDSSSEDAKLLEKKRNHRKNKNKID
jgi:hypothetical protein